MAAYVDSYSRLRESHEGASSSPATARKPSTEPGWNASVDAWVPQGGELCDVASGPAKRKEFRIRPHRIDGVRDAIQNIPARSRALPVTATTRSGSAHRPTHRRSVHDPPTGLTPRIRSSAIPTAPFHLSRHQERMRQFADPGLRDRGLARCEQRIRGAKVMELRNLP